MNIEEVKQYIEERKFVLQNVKELLIDRLNLEITPDEIDDDAGLFGTGLGLDSIDALDLVVGVEERFELTIGEGELSPFKSVNSLTDFIMENNKEGVV